jgi:hypothetical protein
VTESVPPLPFFARLSLAFACFFRVLFDGVFARRVHELDGGESERDTGSQAAAVERRAPEPATSSTQVAPQSNSNDAALELLALLQREGRLVDFLQQDVTAFPDADIGAAARVVHEGCRKALATHLEILPVRAEREGGKVTLEAVDPNAVKLVGNVSGSAPFHGTLRHRGWRVEGIRLPKPAPGYDPRVLAPAEVEL